MTDMTVPLGKVRGDGSRRMRQLVSTFRHRLARLHPPSIGPLLRTSGLLVVIVGVATLPLLASDATQAIALKTFVLVVLSFLPGWLFLRFVVVRAKSVWKEFVLNLHRLGMDRPENLPRPPSTSIYYAGWKRAVEASPAECDVRNKANIYADKFEAYYGKSIVQTGDQGSQLKAETFFPVILATLIFAVGWAAVLRGASAVALPAEPTTFDLLRVTFVGAYLFTLQMLVRRYFQADLKASAYVNAVVRVVSGLVLVTVVDQALMAGWTAQQRVTVAFVIGFFPLVGLQALQKTAAVLLRSVVPSLKNDYPLSDLDGLSVWYEARLLELGIEDLENLATANLVDVILHSRVPVGRLVDWLDQAHLYLHLEPMTRKERKDSARWHLRRLGIRTATALEAALRPCAPSGDGRPELVPADEDEELREALRWAVNNLGREPGSASDGHLGPSVTQSLLKTLRTAPNLEHVRHWKRDWDMDGDAHQAGGPGPQALAAA